MPTDRELLTSAEAQLTALVDQIDGHVAPPPPEPVDCVLGPEQIESETPLEVCQPAGTQRVEVAWTRSVLVAPANGGAACGPMSGTREDVRPCVFVPPSTPGPLPFPGQAQWREVWPGYDPRDLSQAGGLQALFTGALFPGRRAHVEADWWFCPGGNMRTARHNQVGVALPERASGIFDLHVTLRQFKWDERNMVIRGLVSAYIEEDGVVNMLPAPVVEHEPGRFGDTLPITEDTQINWVPVRYDTRAAVSDGWKNLRLRFDAYRISDGIHHLLTLDIPIYLDNGNRPVVHKAFSIIATGWMTEWVTHPVTGIQKELNDFSYQTAEWWGDDKGIRRFVDSPALDWWTKGSTGQGFYPMNMFVTKNPDFLTRVKFDGTDPAGVARWEGGVIVRDAPFTNAKTWFQAANPENFVVGDRIVMRASDPKAPKYVWVTLPDGTHQAALLAALPAGAVVDSPITLTDPNAVAGTGIAITMGPGA